MIADTTRDVITVSSNTGKYPPTYGDLFPYVIERGGTSPDGVEMESSGPWPVTNINTPAGDEARAVAGATGRAQRGGAEAGCRALEDGSGKEGEPEASGAERAGNIDHTAITSIIQKRDVQDKWWILDSL